MQTAEYKEWEQLTPAEQKFVLNFCAGEDAKKAYLDAGYPNSTSASACAKRLKEAPHIQRQIKKIMDEIKTEKIAEGREVLEYLTAVMRGEVRDSFGLETSITERTRAAIEIAKRTVDIDNKSKGDNDISVKLSWE